RNNKHLKVKLSLLALKRCSKLQRLDSERGSPNHSAALIHERCMSLLDLALQHTSTSRPRMDDDLELMIRNASSMKDVRVAAGEETEGRKTQRTECLELQEARQAEPMQSSSEDDERPLETSWVSDEFMKSSVELRKLVAIFLRGGGSEADQVPEAEESLESKQSRQRVAWRASIGEVIEFMRSRFEMLELKGTPVEVWPACQIQRDIDKMPKLKKYFTEAEHTFERTYILSLADCSDSSCEFCCAGWSAKKMMTPEDQEKAARDKEKALNPSK
ncbi:MAG: hypothetical protein SGPRY_014382, partial [Prymnesium sp.]